MGNRKERQYMGKDDSMTDITETGDIFSGHYEIQIILSLITIIVVAMHTTYHFGIILESNSYIYGNNFYLYQFVQYSHHYSW